MSKVSFARSDPTPLGRPGAVVCLRGDVGDRTDLQAGGLERTDGGLTARARALDEHVDLAHAVLDSLARGVLRRHLRGERGRLARALEADVAGGRPADHRPRRVGDRDDGVVERALDVRVAVGDVLLLLAADLLDRRGALTGLRGHLVTWPSSCRRWSSSVPCGCARWSWCADPGPAGAAGAAGPGRSRSPSSGGCPPGPRDAGRPRP